MFEGSPHRRAHFWLAIEEESGETAGITTFFPRRMQLEGRELIGALGGDNYVPPKFRRRGIGSALHDLSRRDMKEVGVQLMFGTAMPANVTPLLSTGSTLYGEAVRYARPLVPLLGPRARGARLVAMEPNDRRVDEAWDMTRDELVFATVRDAAFYEWRFRRSPSQKQVPFVVVDERGSTLGACALERDGARLRVIDLVAPAESWPQMFGAAHSFARESSAMDIKLRRDDADARGLWRHGFVGREHKPITLMIEETSGLREPEGFYFTWAEADQDQA